MEDEISHFSGFPIITEFDENCRDESQEGSFVWEQRRDACSAFEFFVLSFEHVCGSHSFAVLFGQLKDGQPFRDVGFGPRCDLGCGVLVKIDESLELLIRVVQIPGVEDAPFVMSQELLPAMVLRWGPMHSATMVCSVATAGFHRQRQSKSAT